MVRDLHSLARAGDAHERKGTKRTTGRRARPDVTRGGPTGVRGQADSPGKTSTHRTHSPLVPPARASCWTHASVPRASRGAALRGPHWFGGKPGLLAYFILTPLSNSFRINRPFATAFAPRAFFDIPPGG